VGETYCPRGGWQKDNSDGGYDVHDGTVLNTGDSDIVGKEGVALSGSAVDLCKVSFIYS
jgi:hypothetical protein